MGTQQITGISQENFHERIDQAKLTLLYPWTPYRNAFLSYVVDDSGRDLIYYRLTDSDADDLRSWLGNFITAMRGDLGSSFARLLEEKLATGDATDWGAALAYDINTHIGAQPTWIFIDEVDRLPHNDDLQQFIRTFVEDLSKEAHLVVSSRLLKYQPWYDFVANGSAVVFGTERRANDVMFTILDEPKPPLEVYALGRGYALVSGEEITNWDGALPRNLFFFFMDNPLVTRDEIFKVFWPNLTTKEATNVFHVTKRKISERITMKVDAPGNYELTQYSAGFYKPSEKVQRYYDVEEFEEAVNKSMVALDEAEEENLFKQAIDLYKGPFLQDGTMDWMVQRRDELRNLYAQALIGVGRLSNDRGEQMTALGYFVRALKETPEREDIHRDVMQIYINQNMPQDARNQYQMLAKLLDTEYGIGPSKESRDLFAQVKKA